MNFKKYFFVLLLIIAFGIFSQQCLAQETKTFPEVKKLEAFPKTEFLPTLEHPIFKEKNCIYAASLLYCWDEIRKEVGEPIVIDKKFFDLTLIHNSKSHLNVLRPNEYTSSVKVEKHRIIAKAEFNKSLPLEVKLKELKNNLLFDSIKVQSFGLNTFKAEMLNAFTILYYQDDENFIIKLNPKDKEHEIILFKSSIGVMTTMAEKITIMNEKIELGKIEMKQEENNWRYEFQSENILVIPKFKFNLEYNYKNLEGCSFVAKTGDWLITKAYQRTAFLIDQNGAEVESEAVIEVLKEEKPEKPRQKMKVLKFDKSFLLLLKRVNNKNPYFAMWVANAELMEKEEK